MSGTTSKSIAGVSAYTINGVPWTVAETVEYSPSGVTRETLEGLAVIPGFLVKAKKGRIKASLYNRSDATVYSLNELDDASIVVIGVNGTTISGDGMWQVEEITVGMEKGTFDVVFEGDQVTETLS